MITLSDLIGFTYSDWHADDAVANFIAALEDIAKHPDIDDSAVVSVILGWRKCLGVLSAKCLLFY